MCELFLSVEKQETQTCFYELGITLIHRPGKDNIETNLIQEY